LTPRRAPAALPPGAGVGRIVGGLALLLLGVLPSAAHAQRAIGLPSGDTLTFQLDTLRRMMTDAERLRDLLEIDPHVVYYTGAGPAATRAHPGRAYPWIAVRVRSDSAVRVATPSNLREMSRAYANYAVEKMQSVRNQGPATDCEEVVRREVQRISSFLDGWIVSRTLYGGPPFPPVDGMAFARAAGHLPAMLMELKDSELSGCRGAWETAHPDRMSAFRSWREGTLGSVVPDTAATDTLLAPGAADTTGAPPLPADTMGARPLPADTTGGRPGSPADTTSSPATARGEDAHAGPGGTPG